MKKLHFVLIAFTLSAAIISCNKEKDMPGIDNEAVSNEALSTFVEKSLMSDEDAGTMRGAQGFQDGCSWQELMPSCATITVSGETFPKTITIDYGSGCTNQNGITKSGMIIITLSDEMMNNGAIRTVTLQNFVINNTQIEGSRIVTNIGNNESGQPMFHREANLTLTRNGNTFTRTSNEEVTWLSGYDTTPCGDNIFQVTGNGTCTRPNGNVRTRTIIVPLIIDHQCGYITSGVVEITGPNGTGTINFGDGTCDTIAVVTRPNGNVQTIELHQQ